MIVEDRIMKMEFIKGTEAMAEAAVRAGCRFFAGYPITPQNEVPEYLAKRLPEVGGVFVQGESEIASISMVMGASAMGVRAMTSSSSPGISLKSEGISTLAGADLPAVIINVTRGGPGLGSIQAAQMDYFQATKASGHGGFQMIVFAPWSVQEAADHVYEAFEKAAEYQAPMLICVDGCIGAMMEQITLPPMKADIHNELVFTGSSIYNPRRRIVTSILGKEETQQKFNISKAAMYEKWKQDEVRYETYLHEDDEVVFVAYGVSARVCMTAMKMLEESNIRAGLIRPVHISPYPYEAFDLLDYDRVRQVISVELSIPAQMVEDVRAGVARRAAVDTITRSGGVYFTPEDVVEETVRIMKKRV